MHSLRVTTAYRAVLSGTPMTPLSFMISGFSPSRWISVPGHFAEQGPITAEPLLGNKLLQQVNNNESAGPAGRRAIQFMKS